MKTIFITLLACAFSLTVSAKDKNMGGKSHGNSSQHFSPQGNSQGFFSQGKGNSVFNPQQNFTRGSSPGNSAFGHSHNPSNTNYKNWNGNVKQRSFFSNLFNFFRGSSR